jgi:glucose-6-phosphate 1-dehydrogenase
MLTGRFSMVLICLVRDSNVCTKANRTRPTLTYCSRALNVKEGHREADEGKMKEFRGIVRYVNGAYDQDDAFKALEQ